MKNETKQGIVIIGGVAGGASAAARARRLDEGARITLIERGPDVSFANCGLPYHIGKEIEDRAKLSVQTPESLRAMLNIEILTRTEAVSIDRERKVVRIRNLRDGKESELGYGKLILCPGASPVKPPLPGIDLPGIQTLRNLEDMDRMKETVEGAGEVLVIGAGFIGLEMAEQLSRLGKEVTLVELVDQVLPQMDKEMVRAIEDELTGHGIRLVLGDGIAAFAKDGDGLKATLNSGREIKADAVLLSIGVRPESALAAGAGLETGKRGHIVTNRYMQTSDPDIYAAGDVCENADPILGGRSAVPLGGPANRQGRVAADHIMRGEAARPYPGSIGTAIVRVFGMAAGVTGCTEKRLKAEGIAYGTTTASDFQHASYFPGAVHLTLKILWEEENGRILGAQAFGPDGVDKRLDVLATAIRGRMTIEDLEHLELAYAPPFGAAKDPVNIAGFAALNQRDGLFKTLRSLKEVGDAQLIDVRPAPMAEENPIPGAVNIPLPTLRASLDRIDRNKPVVTVCFLGKMSYFAARILQQNGYEVTAHVGGIKVEDLKAVKES